MGLIEWIAEKTSKKNIKETKIPLDYVCTEFREAAQEYALRELAFLTCTNMIANAVGKCDFRTYKNNIEVKGAEAYLWNIEPNVNQNSTVFLNKLITKLYRNNEVLIISTRTKEGIEHLAIADNFSKNKTYPSKENEYTGVIVGDLTYNKTFKESEIMHLQLNDQNVKRVLDLVYESYNKMISAARNDLEYNLGKHMKVHIDQIAQGADEWEQNFTEMLNKQVKPYMQSQNAVLPEFEGYKYEEMGENGNKNSRDVRELYDDIFDFTAKGMNIPPVLIGGEVAGTKEAFNHWLTIGIDPLCNQLEEEINRKRFGINEWKKGNYIWIDTSKLIHFDLFGNANNIDKMIASGVFTINMVLEAAGMPPIMEDWANKHFITKNYTLIEDALKALEGGERNE